MIEEALAHGCEMRRLRRLRELEPVRCELSVDRAGIGRAGLALDETARRRVVGDPVRLRQILTNLLSNAVKFTSAGRVGLSVAKAARGDRYYFEVRDSGIGFEPDQAERLFSRFEQADGSITHRFGGAGLGLSISRQLAELMGGQVSAAGQPGRGAVFTLMLPLIAAREAPAEAVPQAVDGERKAAAA